MIKNKINITHFFLVVFILGICLDLA